MADPQTAIAECEESWAGLRDNCTRERIETFFLHWPTIRQQVQKLQEQISALTSENQDYRNHIEEQALQIKMLAEDVEGGVAMDEGWQEEYAILRAKVEEQQAEIERQEKLLNIYAEQVAMLREENERLRRPLGGTDCF